MSMQRVVLDTNVLVSGIAFPGSIPGRLMGAWRQGALQIVLSHYILDGMVRVLPRLPRIALSPGEIRDLADAFMLMADLVEPSGVTEPDLRDPADQPVLQTLLKSQADYLITGYKDLLVLADRYPILSPAVFWSRFG